MKKLLFLAIFLLVFIPLASAADYPYWRELNNESRVWVNLSDFNGSTSLIISTDGPFSPNGSEVFGCYNDGSSVDTWNTWPTAGAAFTSNGSVISYNPSADRPWMYCNITYYNNIWVRQLQNAGGNSEYMLFAGSITPNSSANWLLDNAWRTGNWVYWTGSTYATIASFTDAQWYVYEYIHDVANTDFYFNRDYTYKTKAGYSYANTGGVAIYWSADGSYGGGKIHWIFANRNITTKPSVGKYYSDGKWYVTINNTNNQSLSNYAVLIDGINLTGNLNVGIPEGSTEKPGIVQNTYNHSTAINVANSTAWRTNISTPSISYDSTPTIRFTTNISAQCRIGITDSNWSTMGSDRDCATTNTTSQVCTLTSEDIFSTQWNKIYLGCANTFNSTSQSFSSTSGALNVSYNVFSLSGTVKDSEGTAINNAYVFVFDHSNLSDTAAEGNGTYPLKVNLVATTTGGVWSFDSELESTQKHLIIGYQASNDSRAPDIDSFVEVVVE